MTKTNFNPRKDHPLHRLTQLSRREEYMYSVCGQHVSNDAVCIERALSSLVEFIGTNVLCVQSQRNTDSFPAGYEPYCMEL